MHRIYSLQSLASSAQGLYRILSSYWLAHSYLMKKSAKVIQYFGLDCGMMEFFKYSTHEPSSKEQLLTLPHFWSPVWRKRLRFVPIQPSAEEVGGLDGFLFGAAQNFEVFSNVQD
jgi:hypothetical protein